MRAPAGPQLLQVAPSPLEDAIPDAHRPCLRVGAPATGVLRDERGGTALPQPDALRAAALTCSSKMRNRIS